MQVIQVWCDLQNLESLPRNVSLIYESNHESRSKHTLQTDVTTAGRIQETIVGNSNVKKKSSKRRKTQSWMGRW